MSILWKIIYYTPFLSLCTHFPEEPFFYQASSPAGTGGTTSISMLQAVKLINAHKLVGFPAGGTGRRSFAMNNNDTRI